MAKVLRYDRQTDTQMGDVSCDHCGADILTEEWYGGTESAKYEGLNHGIRGDDYECTNCKDKRGRAYDDYVDPLRAYH
jgi:hypothetical protein